MDATPLVGRRRELETIKRLLEGHRLVTLTGVGGAGKTRLARRVTADLARVYKDAAWVVELADVQDPDLLGHSVARAIGVQVKSADFDPALLTEFFGDRRVLLTLDNCEHLVEACAALVERLLVACPGLRVLATSQRALGLAAESLFQVPALTLPNPGADVPPEGLHQYESISLFVDRAAAIHPDFQVTEGNAASIVELCRALEGIPLALELAAARTRVLSPQAMVDRLEDRYQLLNRGFRGNVPDRQRSLEASVSWTYDLCSEAERRLWADLSVFRGGFGYDGAEAVAGEDLEDDSFLDVLDSLVERSVVRREDDGGRVRFRMLETLRLYGERELERAGRVDEVRRRHRDHFLARAVQFEAEWTGPRQVGWLSEMQDDHANIRAALQYSVEQSDADKALRILSCLEPFWITSGAVSEARRWLDLALAETPQGDVPSLAVALRVATWFALIQVDMDAAAAVVDGMRVLVGQPGSEPDRETEAQAQLAEGLLAAWLGQTERGVELIERSVEGFEETGELSTRAFALVVSGMLAGFTGHVDRGRESQHRCVALTEPKGEVYMRSFALAILGVLALAEGDTTAATQKLHEALRLKRELGDLLGTALILEFLAWTAVADDQGERAATLLGAAGSVWNLLGVSLDTLPHFSERRRDSELAARSMQPAEAYEKSAAVGANMGTADAITFALDEHPPRAKTGSGQRSTDSSASKKSPLTPREREVALLVQEGLSNQQIAERLVLSTRTAEAHVENILRKLGFSSRASVAAWVAEHHDEVGA
ncbi:LuxR C-terminal-related transcriptional regulator [Nocardioides immobilis]|uniref:LuxR C-terminal-related transcriptional regulator n=1 Tax=Nocardioides immobilis TaxID=2049295 RepID=UPI0015FBC2B6|nr:LuxR C-terminal-related transcriptional regulator [Nocardioides immobilis]